MYKFIMRSKKLILGQKAIFMARGPSNQPSGGSENNKELEAKGEVIKLTKEHLDSLDSKIKQDHIRFSSKESREYDKSVFRGRTIVEVTKNAENVRDGEKLMSQGKVFKGEKLVLTGNYRVLEAKNGSERVYWETVDKSGNELYILGESINPVKTVAQNKDSIDEMTSQGLSVLQANYIDRVRPKTTETPKKPVEKSKAYQEQMKEYLDTPIRRMDKLTSSLTSYKSTRLENGNFKNPNYLKNILKNDQLSDLQRSKIENSMNDLGLTFNELSNSISEQNTLRLDSLIALSPLENESEMVDLRKEFLISPEARALQTEINELKASKNPSDKIKLSQKQEEFKSKQEAYAKDGYAEYLDYYRKSPSTKSVLVGYIQKTQKLAQNNDPKAQAEFLERYQKLQSVYELASTLHNLEVRESTSINRDNVENIETSNSISKIKSLAKENASRLGFGTKELENIETNLTSEAFGEEERNLYLVSLIQLASNQTFDELRRSAVIQGNNDNLSLNIQNLSKLNQDKLLLGLGHTQSISKGFFDNLLDTDNLTETMNTLQNSSSFSTAKKIMYYHEMKNVSEVQKSYSHLNQIFDKNYSGNLTKANDRLYTKTMEDSIGGSSIAVESTNVMRRYSSDLAQYQSLLQEVEVNGVIDPLKLQTKLNELIKLGGLGVKFDERLPESEKKHLERLAQGGLNIAKEDMETGLTSAQISLIRYGTVYEQLRNEFLKESPSSPVRKFEKAGLGNENLNPTMSALTTALQYIENGNLAVGGQTEAYEFGEGWKLTPSGSAGLYFLENPKVTVGGAITIQKKLDNKNTISSSLGAGYGVGPDTLNGGINFDITLTSKSSETLSTRLTAGGGLIIGGVNLYVRGGLQENRILKDKNERMASGLENVSEKKLSKEEITYLKSLANKPSLSPEDIANASKFFPGLEEALKVDPALTNLPTEKLEVFKSNYIQTILRQLDNMTTEEAEGVNWNASLAVGVLLTPAPIPYIIPMVGFEWGGDTKVMKLYDVKNQLTEAQLKEQLQTSLKQMPKGTKLQIVSESGYASNINGKEVVVKGANEVVSNLEISDPIQKLNTLRSNSGIEFSKMNDSFLSAKIDDFKKLREGINGANATKVNVYIDPALEGTFQLGHMDGIGEIGVKMIKKQIPDNLVILRESITFPSTSGGATTEVKISFTTRENLLTGSEIESSSSLYDYVSLNKYGKPDLNRDENNLNYNKLNVNESVSFNKNFTEAEANLLAEYSDGLIDRSSTKLERNTHTPTQKLDSLVDKLAKKDNGETLKKLAKLTINNIEKGQRIDLEAAFKLVQEDATELGFKNLSKEDYIYIYGNLLPNTFRPINKLTPTKRIEAINKLANQYVEEYVRSLTKTNLKPNGQRFSESETQVIIKNLSKHSRVKDSFRDSLLSNEVTLESANKGGLNGYEMFTTAHKGNLKGFRRSEISAVFETPIVKNSLTKFDSKAIEDPKERDLVNTFLQSMSEQVPVIDVNDITPESLRTTEMQNKIMEVLNSRTALQLMSTTPFASNGKKVSLLGAMYGPDALMHIENFYSRMDQLGKPPVGRLLLDGPAKKALTMLIKDIQDINQSNGTINKETYKGEPLEINIKQESGVVLIGKCANPTYVYQRKLGAKLEVSDTAPAAAKANASRIYKLGNAARENMNRIGFGTKLSVPIPEVPTEEIKPPKEDIPEDPKFPPPPESPPKSDIPTQPSGNNVGPTF